MVFSVRTTIGVLLVLVCGLAAGGCGSSSGGGGNGVSDGVAVQVGNYTVSKAEVAHWIPIEAIVSQEVIPKGPIPNGMVPDPPSYTNCLTYQRKVVLNTPGEKTAPTVPQLRRECRERYEHARSGVLNMLVIYGWLKEEAAAHGIKVSDAEAQQRFTETTSKEFKTTTLQQYLTRTGLTSADELLRIKNNLLSTIALTRIFPHQPHPKQAYPEFTLHWVAKTHCAPEYITPNCKEYRGPHPPGT